MEIAFSPLNDSGTDLERLAETCSPGPLTEAQLDALIAYLSTL